MTMRQHDAFDHAEIDAEPRDVAFEGVVLRPGVKQHAVAVAAAVNRHEA